MKTSPTFTRCLRGTLFFTLCAMLLGTPAAFAQTLPIERNPPPLAAPAPAPLVIEADRTRPADNAPLGVTLRAIALIGREGPAPRSTHAGDPITFGKIGLGAVPTAELKAALRPFIGKPLSMALIAQAQAGIADVYRKSGFPFVSVTLPPQEITGGTLVLQVVEFGFGQVKTRGIEASTGARLAAGIRAVPGERIETSRVNEDLRWLNRYPYRRVQGVFSPGDAIAHSDLTLDITPQKPWQVFAGYSNTGTRQTGRDRFFFGAAFGLPWLNDAYGSWQTAGSPDLFEDPDRLFAPRSRARYLSHSARLVIPTFDRQALEISPSFVATRQTSDLFTFDNDAFELPIYYRSALSDIVPGLYAGDLLAGVEFKSLSRKTLFSGIDIGSSRADIVQLVLGWDNTVTDRFGNTNVSILARFNPGGVLGGNTDRDWNAYSNGRVTDISYAYLNGTLDRSTALDNGFSLENQLSFQFAGQALPDTEQMSLGGLYAVRGYGFENSVADMGLVLRNELRLPSVPLPSAGTLQPFVFLDAGVGRDRGNRHTATLAGTGAGLDYRLDNHLSLNLTAAFALVDEGLQSAGNFDLKFRMQASF